MKIIPVLSILLLITLLSTSCATFEVGIEATQTINQSTIETTVAKLAQATLQAGANQPTATHEISSKPTITPTQPIESSHTSPYSGLIFRQGDQLYQIAPDGASLSIDIGLDPQLLPGQFTPRAAISPDGGQLISWWDWSDLWLVDLESGEARNITNTTDSQECCAQFWAGRPGIIVFLTRPSDAEGLSYKMAAVKLDGSDYHLIDESADVFSLPALSPDGSMIGYDSSGKPWIYRWDAGPEAFNPVDYGLESSTDSYGLSSPAWSPTGKYLAWMVSGDPFGNGKATAGVVLFDLEGKTYRLLHPHEPAGTEAGFSPAIWSPDGNWLAVHDYSLEHQGIWVMHLDGSGELLAYSPGSVRSVLGVQVLWSPDSRLLLVIDPNAEGNIRNTFLNVLNNQVETSPLPEGALPIAWLHP